MTLRDHVALVTGATRGAGRGIARELGEAGATVYVTGRTSRGRPAGTYGAFLAQGSLAAMPGSVEDTAEEVTAAGGRGIAVPCDHSDPEQVDALVRRIEGDHGGLHLLVNNAWGGHETLTHRWLDAPFWEQPLDHWTSMFEHGLRNHLVTSRAVAPLLIRQKRGLVVTTTFLDRGRYVRGNLWYDLAKASLNRLAFALAEELRPHGVGSVALSPGWMRTEIILAAFRTDEARWREVPALARTESPRYVGRAVVALASDPRVMERSGRALTVGELAPEYGFTDVDGRVIPPFELDA